MSGLEISSKLLRFLAVHDPMSEECHAVYFMVELRKLLDQLWPRTGAFPFVRFYANWTVHCELDRIPLSIEQIAESIYVEVCANSAGNAAQTVAAFYHMNALRTEVAEILVAVDIKHPLAHDPGRWGEFVRLLTAVVADQPIKDPSDNVSEIRFEPTSLECVLEFNKAAGGPFSHRQQRP